MLQKPLAKMNVQQKVTHKIRIQILSARLQDGSHLNEAAIAEWMGVSRSPVREAIKTLESEGLVETLPTGRSIVVGFTPKDLIHLYDLRFDLEWKAMKSLARRGLTEQQTLEFEVLLQTMESCTDYQYQYLQLDTLFHRKLIEWSNNRPLIRIWSTIFQTILALQEITHEQVEKITMDEFTEGHRAIFESLREGASGKTKTLLKQHIQAGVDIVTNVLERNISQPNDIDWSLDQRTSVTE